MKYEYIFFTKNIKRQNFINFKKISRKLSKIFKKHDLIIYFIILKIYLSTVYL